MRRSVIMVTLACASACTSDSSWTPWSATDARPPYDGEPIELDIDIRVSGGRVYIYPREVERKCLCQLDWPPLGECRTRSDVGGCSCTPPPADCLRTVEVWQDDRLIASHEYWTNTDIHSPSGRYDLPSESPPPDRPFALQLATSSPGPCPAAPRQCR